MEANNENMRICGIDPFKNVYRLLAPGSCRLFCRILQNTLMIVAASLTLLTDGCGASPSEKQFSRMVDKTRQGYKAEDIKAAALPFVLDANYKGPVPRIIASLPLFEQEGAEISVGQIAGGSHNVEGVAFTTGSGFGHWGIVVCPFNKGEKAAKTLNGRIISWGSGVFFFIEN